MAKYRNNISAIAKLFKALGDENRLRVINVLRTGELCVCQITELLGLAPSTVSKHMSVLRDAGLVKSRKDGRWIYYSLSDNNHGGNSGFAPVGDLLGHALEILRDTLEGREDSKQIKEIVKQNPEELCKKQCKR
ncbi:MAG: ArsR family transcriptional regulator [Candidatus Dadabacteria bacterium]|nr:MAG: ArsR family transcriptional regulator [Candidatus Dadabacteria bacterium]